MSKRRTLPPFHGGPLTIPLPAGPVRLRNGVLSFNGCILGMDLDREVALVRLPRRKSNDPGVVMEQLSGWLSARKRHVIRIQGCGPRQRILARIQHPAQVRRIVVYWCRSHLGDLDSRTGRDLPRNVLLETAVRDVWRKAANFWEDTYVLLQALQRIESQLVVDVSSNLASVARSWEYRCARLEQRASNEQWLGPEDRVLIAISDRHLKGSLQFLPAYRMIPHTICRLL